MFFYSNEHGSRVFFDALGPPWPKHPCTVQPWAPATSSARPYSGRVPTGAGPPRTGSRGAWGTSTGGPVGVPGIVSRIGRRAGSVRLYVRRGEYRFEAWTIPEGPTPSVGDPVFLVGAGIEWFCRQTMSVATAPAVREPGMFKAAWSAVESRAAARRDRPHQAGRPAATNPSMGDVVVGGDVRHWILMVLGALLALGAVVGFFNDDAGERSLGNKIGSMTLGLVLAALCWVWAWRRSKRRIARS